MLNIEIYIDTCEDQSAATSSNGGEERLSENRSDGSGNHLSTKFAAWFYSTNEQIMPTIELKNG